MTSLTVPPEAFVPSKAVYSLVLSHERIPLSTASSSISYLLVGRQAATADIRLAHGSVSRQHALLYYRADSVQVLLMIQDLGGKHGTFVNGERLSQAPRQLESGDEIVFGTARESTFRVEREENSSTTLQPQQPEKESTTTTMSEKPTQPTLSNEQQPETTSRQEREAQIAAMVASLDKTPVYYKAPVAQEDAPTQQQQQQQPHGMPLTHCFSIPPPDRHIVTSVALDPAGARMAVGQGPMLHLYDFSGMTRLQTRPFASLVVQDGYPVQQVKFGTDKLVVSTTSPQPTVLDREGQLVMEFVRGDPYVMDMAKTSGHTQQVTGVDWHPFDKQVVLTSSLDGSVRLWNLHGKTQFHKLVCDVVYRIKNRQGQRAAVTAVAFHPAGRTVCLGTACGSVQQWTVALKKHKVRPDQVVWDAHDQAVTTLLPHANGNTIVTRSDMVVKVWNANLKLLATVTNLPTLYQHANCALSPDGKLLLVACSEWVQETNNDRREVGSVKVYSLENPESAVADISIDPGVVQVQWHAKLNQIVVACSNGSLNVYYDESTSRNGALLAVSKAGRARDSLSELLQSRATSSVGEILTPLATTTRRKRNNDDAISKASKLHKPEPPATGIKLGGQSSATATFTQFVSKAISNKSNKIIAGRDPREDLFRYHEETESAKEQKRLLAEKTVEAEEEEMHSSDK
jgi:hypothetical protein